MIFVNIRYCTRTYFAYSAYIFHICAYSAYICLFCLYLYPFCLLEQPTPLKVPPAYATQGPNSLRHSRSHRWAGPATCPGTLWLPPHAIGSGHYIHINIYIYIYTVCILITRAQGDKEYLSNIG